MKTLKHTLSAIFAVLASIVMLPAMADLPSGYRQLDYVDTDGSQWVNTLFRPTCTNAVEIKASFTNAPASAQFLYCSRNKTTSTPKQGHWLYVTKGTGANVGSGAAAFGFADQNNNSAGTESQKVTLSVPHVFFAAPEWNETAMTGLTGYIDEVQAGAKVTGSDFTPGDTDYFCLFGGYSSEGKGLNDSTAVSAKSVCRFYYFKVWDTKDKENLQCHIVPVYGEVEQAIGLYDLVAGRFLPVQGNPFTGACTLSADEDVSDTCAIGGGVTVDLNGHNMAMSAVATNSISAFAGSGYQDLAFLTATKAQAVQITGFGLPGTARVELKIRPFAVSGTQWLFCSRESSSRQTYSALLNGNRGNEVRFDFNNRQTSSNTKLTAGDYELVFDGTTAKPTWSVNGNAEKTHDAESNEFTGGSDLILFGSSLAGTYSGRLYYFTVTTNDTVALDLRPVRRLSDGATGLYDTVGEAFYQSDTSTAFPDCAATPSFINSSETASELRVGQRLIPGYTVVEYITGTGSQYIDTGLVPASTDRVEMKLSLPDLSTTYGFFCSRDSSNGKKFGTLYFGGATKGIRFDFNGTQHNSAMVPPYEDGPFTVALDGSTRCGYLNGTAIDDGIAENNFTPSANLFIFAQHSAGLSIGSYAKGSIYWFRVTSADGAKRLDMVPVVCDADSVAGLYDLVNGVFYPSSSDTAFTAGGATLGGLDADCAFDATEIAGNITLVKNGEGAFDGGGTTLAGALKVNAGTVGGLTLLDGATLDVSGLSGAFSLDDNAIAFADAAKVYVNIGSRTIAKNTPVVSWTSAPSNIGGLKFRLVSGSEESSVIVKDDGLYFAPAGLTLTFY